jgi:hypothetical protein
VEQRKGDREREVSSRERDAHARLRLLMLSGGDKGGETEEKGN